MRSNVCVLCSLLVLAACESPASLPDGGRTEDAAAPDAATPAIDAGPVPSALGPEERSARLVVPSAYDGTTALPAIVLLHGYGANGQGQDLYLGLSRNASRRGFYTVIPDGTVDGSGRRFWNATPACCDFGGTGIDDVAYLTALIDELESVVPVSQVFLLGHSNGGFMSYRMACERSERIAAIVSLAGSDYLGETDCVPDRAVSVLQIHGDADPTIYYEGTPAGYPPATGVVARWAARAGCDATPATGAPLDLESTIAGAETETLRYAAGCTGAEAELWSIRGGGHIPSFTSDAIPEVLSWLSAHAR